MSDDRPEVDMKDLLEQQAAQVKPMIVIEPATGSRDLIETLRSVMPDAKKHHIQYVNLDQANGNAKSE